MPSGNWSPVKRPDRAPPPTGPAPDREASQHHKGSQKSTTSFAAQVVGKIACSHWCAGQSENESRLYRNQGNDPGGPLAMSSRYIWPAADTEMRVGGTASQYSRCPFLRKGTRGNDSRGVVEVLPAGWRSLPGEAGSEARGRVAPEHIPHGVRPAADQPANGIEAVRFFRSSRRQVHRVRRA